MAEGFPSSKAVAACLRVECSLVEVAMIRGSAVVVVVEVIGVSAAVVVALRQSKWMCDGRGFRGVGRRLLFRRCRVLVLVVILILSVVLILVIVLISVIVLFLVMNRRFCINIFDTASGPRGCM